MKPFRFATSGDDVRIWDASTLELLHHFYASNSSKAPSIRWSHDGQQILAVPKSGDCVSLTLLRGPTLRHTNVHIKQGVSSATYASETGRFLGIGCTNGDVLIWDLNTSKPRGVYRAPHREAVTCVCFGACDTLLASGGADGKLVLNNVVIMSTFTELATIPGTVMRQVLFAPLRRYLLVSASSQGRIDMWDASSNKHNHSFSGLHDDCTGIALSHINDSFLLSVGAEGNIGMYDMGTKRIHKSIMAHEGLHSVGFLHDGIHFVVGGVSGQAYVYDLRRSTEPIVGTILAHAGPVTSVCMQPLVLDEETGLSIEQQTASFMLRPKQTQSPTTLCPLVQEEGANAFSPLNSMIRESRSSGRPSASSNRLSQMSTDLAKEGYGMFSPLCTVHSNQFDDTYSSIASSTGVQTSKSEQLVSSPRDNISVSGLESASFNVSTKTHHVVEEAPLSPIDSDCESVIGDKGDFRKSSEQLHEQCDVPELCLDKVTLRGDTIIERNVEGYDGEKGDDALSPSSQDSGNSDPPPSSSDEAEATRVQRMIQRFRCLYGLADDESILGAGRLAQIIRRVVRQELHDVNMSLQAHHQAEVSTLRIALDEVMGELRSLREEIQELKEF